MPESLNRVPLLLGKLSITGSAPVSTASALGRLKSTTVELLTPPLAPPPWLIAIERLVPLNVTPSIPRTDIPVALAFNAVHVLKSVGTVGGVGRLRFMSANPKSTPVRETPAAPAFVGGPLTPTKTLRLAPPTVRRSTSTAVEPSLKLTLAGFQATAMLPVT